MALMMGASAGISAVAPQTASAEISDKFRMEINGVTSWFHDSDALYYRNLKRTNNTYTGKGWNNYTRVVMNYYVDKDLSAHVRLHSNYDSAGNYAKNTNTTGAYFDQSYLQYNDRKNNLHYIVGKKGMTLGQSMVYNSTGNLTGAQISYGNWYDPFCVQLTYGNTNGVNGGGNRVWSAQVTKNLSKATSINATYVRGESNYYTAATARKPASTTHETDSFIDFGGKVKMHGITFVGEWSRNRSAVPQALMTNEASKRAWFIEAYTGPTNDFGSGLPVQKVGTHAFSVRYQDIGAHGTYVHNNTFYDDRKGVRLDYGWVLKKGLSVDFVYARMKDKGTSYDDVDRNKGQWSNIYVAALNYKFR